MEGNAMAEDANGPEDTWPDAALIIAAHGSSRNPDSSRPIRNQADELRGQDRFAQVLVGFLKEEPYLRDLLPTVQEKKVFIVPNMAFEGYNASQVLPAQMGLTGKTTNRIGPTGPQKIHLCEPVGTHPKIAATIAGWIGAVIRSHSLALADTCVLLIGHGSRRAEDTHRQSGILTNRLHQLGIATDIESAFLEEDPLVADWPQLTDAKNVIAMPYLIALGRHGAVDIPRLLGINPANRRLVSPGADAPVAGPFRVHGRQIWYCPPVGEGPLIADVIVERVREFA